MAGVPIMLLGATGQLGAVTARRLVNKGFEVRALVRTTSRTEHLKSLPVELVEGDLLNAESLAAACQDVGTVVATATGHIPSRSDDDFRRTDTLGYQNLVGECRKAGVSRFIYISGLQTSCDESIPLSRYKRETESLIAAAGMNYTILRCDAFMEVFFALLGSDVPIRGVANPTVERDFLFTQKHFRSIRTSIVSKGVAHVAGDGKTLHSFISVENVADYIVVALHDPATFNKTLDIGGPEQLSSIDVVSIYEDLLGRKLKIRKTPSGVFKAMSYFLKPFSLPASNIMAITHMFATCNSGVPNARQLAHDLGVRLVTSKEFLSSKFGTCPDHPLTA